MYPEALRQVLARQDDMRIRLPPSLRFAQNALMYLKSREPRLFALIIAIDTYKSTNAHCFRGAESDAQAFMDYLINHLGTPLQQITLLLNEKATRSGIIDAFTELANDSRVQSGDPIVFYYAGHGGETTAYKWQGVGDTASKNKMIIPYDYSFVHGQEVLPIEDDAIDKLINIIARPIPSCTLVFLDCCQSCIGDLNVDILDQAAQLADEVHNPAVLENIIYDQTRSSKPIPRFCDGGSMSNLLLTACGSINLALEFKGRSKLSMALILLLQTVGPGRLRYCDIQTHAGFPLVDNHGAAILDTSFDAGTYAHSINVHSNNVEGNNVWNTQNEVVNLHVHYSETSYGPPIDHGRRSELPGGFEGSPNTRLPRRSRAEAGSNQTQSEYSLNLLTSPHSPEHHIDRFGMGEEHIREVRKLFKNLIGLVQNRSNNMDTKLYEDEGAETSISTNGTNGVDDLISRMARLSITDKNPETTAQRSANVAKRVTHSPDQCSPHGKEFKFPLSVQDIHSLVKKSVESAIQKRTIGIHPHLPPWGIPLDTSIQRIPASLNSYPIYSPPNSATRSNRKAPARYYSDGRLNRPDWVQFTRPDEGYDADNEGVRLN
ncbi:hypothetical protein GALMADRAFT_144792 [Galerina marginata CBS 339.88]|uniref:Peptidase C14 caspase domain-containing protein n=1 Tax=Galerina marginata (strain CBS 339.88) TaxID=685588 RepID=A0A067SKI9_GALM3|nr:hypothetical protein GALMADRAFT_144792 [Galerina marginata CBS 339.88]